MRIQRGDSSRDKGWYFGPWNSDLPISLGYANTGVNEPHFHRETTEIYLVAKGTSAIKVGDEEIALSAGDVLVVEPGEVHTFLSCSSDYLHFVIHAPGLEGERARNDKQLVSHPLPGAR